MKASHRARAIGFATVALLIGFGAACTPGGHRSGGGAPPTPVKIYDSNPSPLPDGVFSQGYECCSVFEFGDEVTFAGTARKLTSATLTLANWSYHSAYPGAGDATGWDQPITLNIYAAGPGHTVGALLKTTQQLFHIPWRHEPDAACGDTRYVGADTLCHNSSATQVTFDLSGLHLTAPNSVVWGVAFNTQHYGETPIGVTGPYNSLNVGTQGNGASIGTDVEADTVFGNSTWGGFYCDGGAGGTGTFRRDSGCRAGYTPEISFSATT